MKYSILSFMEYRKIQKTGGSTYIVSLPKDWVIENDLKEGDTLNIEKISTGVLEISSGQGEIKSEKEVGIQISNNDDENHFIRKLIAIYLSGYAIIKISGKDVIDKKMRTTIEKFSTMVIGMEIIEEGKDYVILQDLSSSMDLPMTRLLARMYLMTESMIVDTAGILKNMNLDIAEDIVKRDTQVDRIYWLISKQFYMIMKYPEYRRLLDVDPVHGSNIKSIAKSLERISDHAENIVSIILNMESMLLDGAEKEYIESLFTHVINMLKTCYRSYTKKDVALANEVIDTAEYLYMKNNDFIHNIEKRADKNLGAVALITESVIRIGMYSADIAEIAINDNY